MDHSDSRHLQAQQQTPYYAEQGGEAALFAHAFEQKLPVLIKGPTGCGKTRFVEHMAARLGRPLITVSCHDDLSAADLVGRHLLTDGGTVWSDGPLTRAVRQGAICYLDEVVEARKDTTVVLHPLADDRRVLPIERTGEQISAAPGFMLVVSFNPGYQNVLKSLKPSTRQRFIALNFNYPAPEVELRITPADLARLAAAAMAPPPAVELTHLHGGTVSLSEQVGLVAERLRHDGTSTFRALIADCDRLTTVVRFLAILELFRAQQISLDQVEPLADLTVAWTAGDADTADVTDDYDAAPSEDP